MIRSNLYDYSDAYIHVKGTIIVPETGTAAAPNNRNKKVIFANCAPITNCISETNNTQVDDAHDIDIVKPMYNLIEYSNIYSETLESLWQYYRDDNNNSILFKFKEKIKGQTGSKNTKDVEIMVPLKYLSNF